jgi:uncharacterized protein (DUF885 family)
MMPMRIASLAALILAVAGCTRQQSTPAATVAASQAWASTRDALIEEYLKARPTFAVYQGRHEFDGQLPDWSSDGIAAEVKRLHAARDRAMAVTGLSGDEAFERDYLISEVDDDLFWFEEVQQPFSNPAFYIGQLDPSPYLTRNYAPLEQRMRAYITYARAIPRVTSQIRATLRTPLAKPLAERGVSGFGGYADFYKADVAKVFADVKDAPLQKELADANTAASKAMADLAAWLKEQMKTATASYALGPELFAKMIRATEGVTTPLADLESAARADLARNQQALRDACSTYAPGATMAACATKMAAHKSTGGPIEGARAQLEMLKQFVSDQGVATIPGPEQALVDVSPPYNRANAAYIDIPGPYEKNLPSIYYISPPDPSWTAAERRDYVPGQAVLLFTSVHEVWPGHFLQYLHANRNRSIIGKLFVGYAFSEGWAHYVEEAMWEMGLGNGDAETHIGQLSEALLRNCRFISAIGLHTKGMTVEESERLFHDECFQDIGNSRQQARRGTYDPAYLNYTMGKLMIRKLRDDWTASRGGRTAWKEFHDAFLNYGGPPIPMVRQQMMGSGGSLF